MRNRCSYNADDVHIFASVPLSARRFPLPDPVPRGRPARRKSSRHPPRNPPRNTITHGSHGPLFMQTTMHTTRRHEPYTLLKSLCQTGQLSPDGSTVIRAYAASRGPLGVGGSSKQQQRTSTWESRVDRRGRVGKCRLARLSSAWSRVWTVRRECRVERSRVACRLSRVVAGAPVSTPRIGYDY